MKTKHIISSLACSLAACLATPCFAAEPEPAPPAVFGGIMEVDKLMTAKKWDEAEQTLRALIRDPGVAPEHPVVGTLHLKQAELYQGRNQSADAFAAAAAAVPIFEKALGRENPFSMAARWIAAQEAMKAGKPLDSAQQAALLREILKDYVGSGRAAAAQWETVPDFKKLLAILPRFDESGIAAVSSLLGRAWAAAGEREKAAPVLTEAVGLLEKLHGPGHPDLVIVQQTLETISAARGDAAGRRYVGDLDSTRKLVFEGNLTFPAVELRKALAMDVGFVLASHPSAEFADFPPVIQKALRRGYFNEGFPKAAVEVTRDPTRDGGCLVVKITEGPRFLMGKIRIEGAKDVNPEDLRRKLLVVDSKDHDGSLAGMIDKMMNGYAKLLPQPEAQAANAMVQEMNRQIPSFKMGAPAGNPSVEDQPEVDHFASLRKSSDSTSVADWIPGDPAVFTEPAEDPLLDTIQQRLAELGRPLARLQTRHEFKDDGTVDLVIRLENEGPVAVIGKIHVIGCQKNTVEEVAKASGLVPGEAFTPQAIEFATVALWNTGRFFPFTVTSQPQGHQNKEIDITIQAREIAGVTGLSDALAPELETARRFIATLNEWLATGNFKDFQWTMKGEDGDQYVLGISSRDGLFVKIQDSDSDTSVSISASQEALNIEMLSGDLHGRGSLPGLSDLSVTFIHVLPTAENDGKVGFGTGLGYSSKPRESGRLFVNLLVSPAFPLLRPQDFRLEGDQVVYLDDKTKTEILRLDVATALPVVGGNTGIEFREGIVKEQQATMAAKIAKDTDARIIPNWIEAFEILTGFIGSGDPEAGEFFGTWLRLASNLLKPETLKPFKELYAKWSEGNTEKDGFIIPLDPDLLQDEGGTMSLLIGLGAVSLSELLAPADSWASKLSRELVFIYGGKTQYTSRTIDQLLADPSIGPYGCIMISQLLGKFDAGTARRFLAKALDQADEEGFRRDWRFWLDSPTGLGKTIDEFLTALAAITPEEEKTATELLEPAQAEWLRGLLTRLRLRPDGQKLADWIAPQLDGLWNHVIGDSLRKNLESQLGPAADPAQVAAMVNGQPVRRILVRAINDVFLGQGILQPATEDATRPWTKDPALSLAIRLTLLEQDMLRRGFTVQESQVNDMLARGFPELKDQPDEEWLAATGMKQEEYGHIIGKSMVLNTITTMVTNSVEKASDSDVEIFYQKFRARISRKAHLHMMAADRGDGRSLTRTSHAARLARQTAAALDAELPFAVMTAATRANSLSGLTTMCQPANAFLDLSASVRAALETMEPGETTQPMAAGNKSIMIRFEGWKISEPLPLEDIRQELASLVHDDKVRQSLDATCRQQESSADIIVLENPEPGAAEESVFNELLQSDSFGEVGQLGVFWDHVRSNEKDPADHLQKLIDSGFMEPSDLVLLADALLARDQKPLAAMCVTEAADRDDKATRQAIAAAVSRHKTDGTKGQQDQLETLVAPRK